MLEKRKAYLKLPVARARDARGRRSKGKVLKLRVNRDLAKQTLKSVLHFSQQILVSPIGDLVYGKKSKWQVDVRLSLGRLLLLSRLTRRYCG